MVFSRASRGDRSRRAVMPHIGIVGHGSVFLCRRACRTTFTKSTTTRGIGSSRRGLAAAIAFRDSGLYNDVDARCASICGARGVHPQEPYVSVNVRELFEKRLALLNGSIRDYLGRFIDPGLF